MRELKQLIVVAMTILLVGCDSGPKSGRGFTLPDGNADRGEIAFVDFRCHECHTVAGVDLPAVEGAQDPRVKLGGEVNRISSYGELVTSIINPSHKLARGYKRTDVAVEGESKMANYNDVMSVARLIDIVAFLQSQYKLQPYEPSHYPLYY